VEQAIKCLIVDQDGRRGFGTIQLYDEHEDELEFVSFYSPEESPRLRYRIGDRRKLGAGKKGLTARAVRTLEPQLVNNVRASEDYHEFDSRTRSELDAPLVENGRPLGVLNIEGFEFTTFDDLDLKILQALAELAVIAIQNGRQLEVIRRTQGLVAASTAVAWIGMASSVWGHGMRNTAITIRNLVTLLRDDLVRMTIDAESHEVIENKLLSISKLAENIFNRRITVPLSSEEGVVSIPIKDWLIGWEDRLREYRYHEGVSLILDLETCADVKVRCDPIWMTEVLDILFENAIAAVGTMPAPSLMLSAHVANDKVEIAVTDNGPGIPPDVRNILFKEPVRKSANDRGTGVGLLMARVIAQAYGGEVGVKSTGPEGTTMVIQLPVEH
jgi:signal transduction histidine kinase